MLAHVYRDVDADHYVDHVKPDVLVKDDRGQPRPRDKAVRYFKQFLRRHQMSDHKLLWCEIRTDFSDDYLGDIIAG
jgi:hypothetical protein